VQEVVKMGIVPLITTVSSYMIIPLKLERQHLADFSYFIHDKDEDIYKARTIRNCCLDMISSLIEVFGDLAVESILFVIENILFLSAQSQEQKAKSPQKMTLTKTVEEINIYEFTYNSKNLKHFWKKREVALYLVGSFAEDVSMYR
jgi:hypothetical protein